MHAYIYWNNKAVRANYTNYPPISLLRRPTKQCDGAKYSNSVGPFSLFGFSLWLCCGLRRFQITNNSVSGCLKIILRVLEQFTVNLARVHFKWLGVNVVNLSVRRRGNVFQLRGVSATFFTNIKSAICRYIYSCAENRACSHLPGRRGRV